MLGGVTRHMLPRLPRVPHLHVNRPLVARMFDNCDALQILLFLVCDESSILVKPRVVIVVHCYSFLKQNSNSEINTCKKCNTVNLYSL